MNIILKVVLKQHRGERVVVKRRTDKTATAKSPDSTPKLEWEGREKQIIYMRYLQLKLETLKPQMLVVALLFGTTS